MKAFCDAAPELPSDVASGIPYAEPDLLLVSVLRLKFLCEYRAGAVAVVLHYGRQSLLTAHSVVLAAVESVAVTVD